MGNGRVFRCGCCKRELVAESGIGMLFPEQYRGAVRAVLKGKYGPEWKELFENTPGAALDVERELYYCGSCEMISSEFNMTLYAPKEPAVPEEHTDLSAYVYSFGNCVHVVPWELKGKYRRIRTYVHKCRTCGKRMRRYREGDRVRCPMCLEGWLEPAGEE